MELTVAFEIERKSSRFICMQQTAANDVIPTTNTNTTMHHHYISLLQQQRTRRKQHFRNLHEMLRDAKAGRSIYSATTSALLSFACTLLTDIAALTERADSQTD
eukprot:scaffold195045_cov37-Attheya_sp.AAC.1